MKAYVATFPAPLVARDQLEFAVAELSTHDNQRFTKALTDAGNVLSVTQRQAFFKAWNERGPGHGPRKG